ncbi:MAG TPA: glycosyltransferase family A protein [Pyrinomonadaceae bacterium]
MSLTSIIIPTHNRPHLLTRAVESAHAAGTNIEVIVVDDASTDETASVCTTLREIKYVRVERNQGVAGARNVGLLASCGEYVTFLDDDDLRLPDSLDEQVKLLEADKEAGLIFGQAFLGDESCKPTNEIYPVVCAQGDAFWDLLAQNFIPCGSAVFRRSCLNRIGLLDGDLPGLDDWDLWIRIAELYPIIALERPVMIWRRSTPISGQGTSQAAYMVSQAVRQFRRSWMKLPRAANAQSKMRRAAWQKFSAPLAAHVLSDARSALRIGDITRAANNVLTLAHLCPLVVLRLLRKRSRLRLLRTIVGQAQETSASYSGSIHGDHPCRGTIEG